MGKKIRVIILQRNRRVEIKEVNPKKDNYRYRKGLYILSQDYIANWSIDDKVQGSEAIYFEGNPNPVFHGETKDKSGTYLDDKVRENALRQTSLGPKFDFSWLGDILGWLKDPDNLIYLVMGLVILYGLLVEFLGLPV